jgi:predicted nucleic-acid-binding protein
MIGLDTNVLIRWLVHDQLVGGLAEDQAEALRSLFENNDDGFFINEIVVVEIAWVLKQRARLPKAQILDILSIVLDLENAVVKDREVLIAALKSYENFAGDFSDHFIGEINRRQGCSTTMTFDKAAAKSPHFTELRS